MKKNLSLIAVVVTIFFMCSTNAQVVNSIPKTKTADPLCLSETQPKTNVSLTFPSMEKPKLDVVFVLDGSRTASEILPDKAIAILDSLHRHADLSVGIVKFRGQAFDMIHRTTNGSLSGLIEYSKNGVINTANVQRMRSAMSTTLTLGSDVKSGSNVHGGLQIADTMLAASLHRDTTKAGLQFLILLSDMKANVFNSDDYKPTSIFSQSLNRNYGIEPPCATIFGMPLCFYGDPGTPTKDQDVSIMRIMQPKNQWESWFPGVTIKDVGVRNQSPYDYNS